MWAPRCWQEGLQRYQDSRVGKVELKGLQGHPVRVIQRAGAPGARRVVGHSHRKRTYQMVSFFSWGPNRGFS